MHDDAHHPKQESHREKALNKKLFMQRKIDDAKIALVYEALTKGVELEGNDLYYEMLDYYPHFQNIFSKRKAALNKFKRLANMHN